MKISPAVLGYLAEFEEELLPLQQALDDDGLDDYSEVLQSILVKITQLKNIVSQQLNY